ncbi:MAG TPA: hypothetical protein VEH06_07820 [Candidatus Bathyarchaeia archaeon]|nr:hypothetical protein [Candidatus Bathyarchaeia archaeon]
MYVNRKLRQKIIGFTGLGITAVLIAMFSISHLQSSISENFSDSYQNIVTQARQLTHSFQGEMGKWQSKQYDNITMIRITNTYLPRFQKLINNIESLQSTPKFDNTKDFYAKSLESEMLSYTNFRNYLLTDNPSAYKQSLQLLSDSLNYETKSFNAFRNVT